MAKRQAVHDMTEDPRYHDTWKLLKRYGVPVFFFLNNQVIPVRVCLAKLEDGLYFIIPVKQIEHPVGLFE